VLRGGRRRASCGARRRLVTTSTNQPGAQRAAERLGIYLLLRAPWDCGGWRRRAPAALGDAPCTDIETYRGSLLRFAVSYGVNLPGRVLPSCVAEESRYFLRWPYHIFVSPATYCSSNTNFRRTVQWFPTCLPHAPFSSDARMSSPLFQDSLTQTMHTKLEALGQCIPPPRHVLPVPPSG